MRVLFLLLFSLRVRCQYILCGWERPHYTSYGDTQVSSKGHMIGGMVMLSALLAICVGDPHVLGDFPLHTQRARNAEL